jgi:hypothetical protein
MRLKQQSAAPLRVKRQDSLQRDAHVDRGNYISERGPRASVGVDPKEIEANQFAAALLMPSEMVKRKVADIGGGALLDYHVSRLADEFNVSELAMTIRLTSMGLL